MTFLDRSTVDTSIEEAAESEATVKAALRAFFNLAALWQLSEREQLLLLGSPSASTLYAWKAHGTRRLAPDVLRRISYLLGIHAALRRLFAGAPARAAEWMRRPNAGPLTEGRTPLEYVLTGGPIALHTLRAFLEAEAGGSAAPSLEEAYR